MRSMSKGLCETHTSSNTPNDDCYGTVPNLPALVAARHGTCPGLDCFPLSASMVNTNRCTRFRVGVTAFAIKKFETLCGKEKIASSD